MSLTRRTAINQISPRRAAELLAATGRMPNSTIESRYRPALPPEQRSALRKRSGGWCEIAGVGCWGRATDPAHRKGNKYGGRHGEAAEVNDRLSNVLHACRGCHSRAHDFPAAAQDAGWMLTEDQDPAAEPVLYRGLSCLLGDDGTVVQIGETT